MSNKPLTKKPEWSALNAHHAELSKHSIASLFEDDSKRFLNFSAGLDGLLFDYSKNLITDETIKRLTNLANACDLDDWKEKMFSGDAINNSEERAVLHTALRGSVSDDIEIDGENVSAFVAKTLTQIKSLSYKIRNDKMFTDIVNIGVGGSDIGPHMVCEAMAPFADGPRVHFISNVDGAHLSRTLDQLTPEKTLFIVSSKSFTTLETIVNAKSAKAWLGALPTHEHLIAITENEEEAVNFGVASQHVIPMRSWIGGRYSLWSGIGVSIALSIGYEGFEKLLSGAHSMDQHFKAAPVENNIPVLMALIGIWHRNFCDYDAQAIIPYAQNLNHFPAYIQQIDMESNGKSVDRDGNRIDYQTSPVVFGGTGTDSQHAFFQMFHQGTTVVPCDLIVPASSTHDLDEHHDHIIANAVAQGEALMRGDQSSDEPHKYFEGNRPSSTLVIQTLDPYHLGMVLALYEHKIFTQGVIWNLNSFDQWGVELGKKMAKNISQSTDKKENIKEPPSSTRGLLDYILRNKA